MTVTVSRTMGHVIEVNPPDLAAQPSMISLKCQIPRFGWNPDAVSTVSNRPQHASLLHQLPWYIFALAQRLGWMFQHLTGSQMSPAADKNPGGFFFFEPTPGLENHSAVIFFFFKVFQVHGGPVRVLVKMKGS